MKPKYVIKALNLDETRYPLWLYWADKEKRFWDIYKASKFNSVEDAELIIARNIHSISTGWILEIKKIYEKD